MITSHLTAQSASSVYWNQVYKPVLGSYYYPGSSFQFRLAMNALRAKSAHQRCGIAHSSFTAVCVAAQHATVDAQTHANITKPFSDVDGLKIRKTTNTAEA